MPISVVQSAPATGGAGATASASLPSTAAGNAIIVALFDQYETAVFGYSHTVTDGTNSYTKVVDHGSANSIEYWIAHNIAAGSRTVQASQSGGGYIAITAIEVSGLATASAFDVDTHANSNSSAFDSGATATTAQADELLFGLVGAIPPGTTFTSDAGWTDLGMVGTGLIPTTQFAYKIVSATGGYHYTGARASSGDWHAAIATFKAATGGGGGATASRPIFRKSTRFFTRRF